MGHIKLSDIQIKLGTVWKIFVAVGTIVAVVGTAMNLYFLPRYEYAEDTAEIKAAVKYVEKIFKEASAPDTCIEEK